MAGDVKNYPGGKPIVILGTDGTDLYGITVDIAGHLQVDVLSNALPTGAATEATLASIKAAIEKIDDFAMGTNKLFGYYDRYSEKQFNGSLSAGTNYLDFTAVPSGEIWILQGIAAYYVGTAPSWLMLEVSDGSDQMMLKDVRTDTSGQWHSWTGEIVLKAGDYVRVGVGAATLNDDLYAHAWGYKMKIA